MNNIAEVNNADFRVARPDKPGIGEDNSETLINRNQPYRHPPAIPLTSLHGSWTFKT